jgi:hypothetical protein
MSSCPNDPSCGFVVIGKKTGDGLRGREAVKLEAREHCYLRDHETIGFGKLPELAMAFVLWDI